MLKLALLIIGTCILAQMKSEPTSKEISDSSPKFEAKDTKLICDATGICQGNLIGVFTRPSKQDCITLCHNEISCTWLSFSDMEKNCLTYSSCPELDESYESYVSGQEGCYKEPSFSTILVSTGRPQSSATQTTEVINLQDNSICQDIEAFPLAINSAVGAYLGSFPVICGGYDGSGSLNQCHQLRSGVWQPFATLNQRREGAAGIVHANTFIIFGGTEYNGSGYLSTTEIITEEGQVTPGPEMPEAVRYHSIASLDEKTWILTGGGTSTSGASDVTWIFDHVSQEFQQGPPLITERKYHASATLQDQDTKENIVAVVGGYNYDAGVLDSTEFLRNGEWTPGPQMPQKLRGLSAVILDGDLYTIGGVDGNDYQNAIYSLSCSSGNCSWKTMDQELKVGRAFQVSFVVPNDLCK